MQHVQYLELGKSFNLKILSALRKQSTLPLSLGIGQSEHNSFFIEGHMKYQQLRAIYSSST